MTFEEFEHVVARHGTDPAHWPDPDVATRPDVRDWLSRERAMDAALHGETPEGLSANFADRVMAELPADAPARPTWWMGAPIAAALIVAAMFGWSQTGVPTGEEDVAATEWASLASDTGFGELYSWTMEGDG